MMIDVPIGGWTTIVGEEFESEYLDLEYLRKKSERLQAKYRRPAVRKLTTPDGRNYKLLFVPEGNKRLRGILRNISPIKHSDFVPQLLWADNTSLLFEYIDGNFPNVASDSFSRDMGKIMAALHAVRFPAIRKIKYRLEFKYNLKSLSEHQLFTPAQIEQARRLYKMTEPDKLLRSLDYFDITSNNFIYNSAGELKLIDAGSFRRNRLMGQFFVGNTHFPELNTELFWEAYLASTDNHYVYNNFNYIKLFHLVMKTGQRARAFAASSDKSTLEAKRHWQRCTEIRDSLTEFLDSIS